MTHTHDEDEIHEHDLGLAYDLPRMLDRRHVLGLLGGAGLVTLVGCSSSTGSSDGSASSASSSSS